MSLLRSHSQWPEVIPSFIRQHEEAVEPKNLHAATRAWRYFVRERQQKTKNFGIYDFQSFQSRAPKDEPSFFDGPEFIDRSFVKSDAEDFCMVYICITELNEEKQALLAKCTLALFPWEDGEEFLADKIVMFLPLKENKSDILDSFKLQQSAARPNFLDMHMALDGTWLFRDRYAKLIIDDRTLETGLGLWVEFGTTGVYEKAYRAQMMSEALGYCYREIGPGNQTPIERALEYIESRYVDLDANRDPHIILEEEPVDMRKPLVGIYQGREVEQVDDYAPGFREAEEEGNGLVIGYDLRQILATDGGPLMITDRERL
ncbi:hypothetical protein N7493_002831 [Penicillium malachiteum]|uniref:Uncharacterized protein n=1 Tax=Penicillium malachiteum TaxID=1324776 RepID=A0AAD6HSY4_9EURO|nr:hypothetical protein N7493_002831 [Penicillium malachiteum]